MFVLLVGICDLVDQKLVTLVSEASSLYDIDAYKKQVPVVGY